MTVKSSYDRQAILNLAGLTPACIKTTVDTTDFSELHCELHSVLKIIKSGGYVDTTINVNQSYTTNIHNMIHGVDNSAYTIPHEYGVDELSNIFGGGVGRLFRTIVVDMFEGKDVLVQTGKDVVRVYIPEVDTLLTFGKRK